MRDVPASFCCGEDWDHVEENGLGTISAERETLKPTCNHGGLTKMLELLRDDATTDFQFAQA
jgi:hypothetical protein